MSVVYESIWNIILKTNICIDCKTAKLFSFQPLQCLSFFPQRKTSMEKRKKTEAECLKQHPRALEPSFHCLQLQAHQLQEQARRNELMFTYCTELCSEIHMQKLTHSLVKLNAFQAKHSNRSNSEHIKQLVLIFISVLIMTSEQKNSAPFHPEFCVGFKTIYINQVQQGKIPSFVCSHNTALVFPLVFLNLSNYFLKTISQKLCFSVNVLMFYCFKH